MDFRILGPLEVLDGDRVVPLGGDGPPATAAKILQAHVSRLRKALGDDGAIVTRAHGYELVLDATRVDAHRFQRLVADGHSALAAHAILAQDP